MIVLYTLGKDHCFQNLCGAKNLLQVRIADNSVMSHNEAIEGLSIELGGVQCIILVLWATDQSFHDIIIESNFQRLYSLRTQIINQIIVIINSHSFPIEKLSKVYIHQKIKFRRNQRSKKVMSA